MTMSDAVMERARALIGTRFRAQGRDARFGLDCVGLVLAAHRLPVSAARRDYALRGTSRGEIAGALKEFFRRVPRNGARDGDVLLLQAGAGVLHLGVKSGAGMIHADIRGGVVERPGPLAWPVLAAYRRRVRSHGEG